MTKETTEPRTAPRIVSPAIAERARALVRENAVMCAAVSFVPNPIANSLAITGVQLKMLADLSKLYGVPFSQDIVRSLLTATAGGLLNFIIARNPVTRGVRDFLMATVPLIALPMRFLAGPAFIAGYTLVLGNSFIRHYECGGSYLNFNWRDFRHELAHKLGLPRPAPNESPIIEVQTRPA